jgi:hypothetical protein
MEFWYKLPAPVRTSLVALFFVVMGIATEWLTKVLESMQGSPVA